MNNEIISFDSERIKFAQKGNEKFVRKITNENELFALKVAHQKFDDRTIIIDGKEYAFKVPKFLSWDSNNNVMCIEFCEGQNLEMLIRNRQTRKKGVYILQEIFKYILEQKIFWNDFAPRNILFDENGRIVIVDFEKGFGEDIEIDEFLQMRVYREYSSFLLPEERLLSEEDVFLCLDEDDIEEYEKIEECSPRIRKIANLLGYEGYMSKKETFGIQKSIIRAETPYIHDDEIVYPRIYVEEFWQDKSCKSEELYARFIIDSLQENNLESNENIVLENL